MPERQDYVMRLIEELGQFLAEALRFRQAGSHDAALLVLLQAQQRLFARPPARFMGLPVEEQVRLLALDQAPAAAREKCLAYATLLAEAGRTYQARGQNALADGAGRLAMQVLELAAQQLPAPDDPGFRARTSALLDAWSPDGQNAAVRAWLRRPSDRTAPG
jgi:hypothetical protein